MAKDFLHLVIDFFRTNWLEISLASLGIFFIISYIILNNIVINPPQPLKRGRTIVLETLINKSDTDDDADSDADSDDDSSDNSSDDDGKGSETDTDDPSEDMDAMLRNGFCKTNKLAHTLEKNCKKLSEKSCNTTSCCVYAHNSDTGKFTCVGGSGANGPTYKGDSDGNYYSWDYWYYLGKKYPTKK